MTRFITVLTAAIVMATATQAQTFKAKNRLQVAPVSTTDFEVIEAYGEGAQGIWCAAGDYAARSLRISYDARIHVRTPRGPSVTTPGRKGVVFTTDGSGLTPDSSALLYKTIRLSGTSMKVNAALSYCQSRILRASR